MNDNPLSSNDDSKVDHMNSEGGEASPSKRVSFNDVLGGGGKLPDRTEIPDRGESTRRSSLFLKDWGGRIRTVGVAAVGTATTTLFAALAGSESSIPTPTGKVSADIIPTVVAGVSTVLGTVLSAKQRVNTERRWNP